jgi:membrane protease YdiL (CAAX protease family)
MTSSPISNEPSSGRRTVALVAWLALAALQVTVAFLAAASDRDGEGELIYDYTLAFSVIPIYGVLIGLTFAIAAAYPEPLRALGLSRFSGRWFGIAVGAIFLALVIGAVLEGVFDLNAGEEQGLAPESWRPERAAALVLNAVTMTTVVPFAEELFFRGLGVPVLGIFGGAAAIVGTAAAFALAHGILAALPTLMIFAIGLGWVRLRSGSVWPGVLAHGIYNGLVLALSLALL